MTALPSVRGGASSLSPCTFPTGTGVPIYIGRVLYFVLHSVLSGHPEYFVFSSPPPPPRNYKNASKQFPPQ